MSIYSKSDINKAILDLICDSPKQSGTYIRLRDGVEEEFGLPVEDVLIGPFAQVSFNNDGWFSLGIKFQDGSSVAKMEDSEYALFMEADSICLKRGDETSFFSSWDIFAYIGVGK